MAEIDDGFDANDYDSEEFEPVPGGRYTLISEDEGERVENSKKTGELLKFKFKIVEGKHAGRVVFEQFNWTHDSDTAQKIGRQRFASYCKACGIAKPRDTKELKGVPFQAEIKAVPAKDGYKARNEVDSYIEKGSSDKNKKAAKKAAPTKKEDGKESDDSAPAWA